VVRELLNEEKARAQRASEYQVHPHVLRAGRAVAGKQVASRFDKGDALAKFRAAHAQPVEALSAPLGRVTTHLAWVPKKLASTLPRAERRERVSQPLERCHCLRRQTCAG